MNSYLIEKANTAHLDELEMLYDKLNDYLASTVNYPGWIKHIYPVRETAAQAIEEQNLFVAQADGKIAGSVVLSHIPEKAYEGVKWLIEADYNDILVMRTLVVNPSFLRKGVGASLLEFARRYANGHGCKSIRLDVSVRNIPAIALYEKMGYRYIDTVDLGLPYEHLKWFKLYELLV